jgi:transporter family protein
MEDGNELDNSSNGAARDDWRNRYGRFIISMAVVVIASSLGDVLLKYSLKGNSFSLHSFSAISSAVLSWVTNVWLIVAITCMFIQFVAFLQALRLAPLSLVVPLRSTTYVVTALLAWYILHERIPIDRWEAIAVILIGVSLIGISGGNR